MTAMLTFAVAVLALLAVPGPTNTLLAASGASAGVRRSLRLLPGEIGGYLAAIAILTQLIAPLLGGNPSVPVVSKALASVWLIWSAIRLWRDPAAETAGIATPVTIAQLFLTTLLNPKALIFAFVIFPPGRAADLWPYVALFCVLVVSCGAAWIVVGDAIGRSTQGFLTRARIARIAAVVLCIFAAAIGGAAVAPFLA